MRVAKSLWFAAVAVAGFEGEDDDLSFLRALQANSSNVTTTTTTSTTTTAANTTTTEAPTTTTTVTQVVNTTATPANTTTTVEKGNEEGSTTAAPVTMAPVVTYAANATVDANATREAVTATIKISAPTPSWASSGDLSWKTTASSRRALSMDAAEAAKMRSAYNLYCGAVADAVAVTSCNVLDAQGKINADYASSNGGGYYFAAISECYTVLKSGQAKGTTGNCWDTAGYCLGNKANHDSIAAITAHKSCVTENAADDYSVATTFEVPPEKLSAAGDASSLDLASLVATEAASTAGAASLKKNLKASTIVAVAFIQENVYGGVETNLTAEFGVSAADLKAIATAASASSGDASLDAVLTATASSAYTSATNDMTVDYSSVSTSADSGSSSGGSSSTSAASTPFATGFAIVLLMVVKFLF